MLTTAVGLVDRAANEETFLVVKAASPMTTATTKADGDDAPGLKLPADAKQSLTDGLTEALEKLSALAQQVMACTVDDTAECPPELATQIDELADDLDDLADEFMPKAAPTQMADKAKARKANATAKAATSAFKRDADGVLKAKPFPGAAPPFGKDKDPAPEDAGAVAKDGAGSAIGSPPGEGAGKDVPRDPPGEGPGGGAGPAQNAPGDTDNPVVMMKSGRKIAKERLETLTKSFHDHKAGFAHLDKAVACMKSGHQGLENVLKDVYDGPGYMQPPGAAPDAPPAVEKPAPAEPMVSPRAAAPDTTGMAKSITDITKAAIEEQLKGPLDILNKAMAGLHETKKSFDDAAALNALRNITSSPRSQPNDGQAPPAARPKTESWPSDMSAAIKQKRAAAK
jgi:hypothetical protein